MTVKKKVNKYVVINSDEQIPYELAPGVNIFYRRPNQLERNAWTKKHTNGRGMLNDTALAVTALRACVLDWEGFYPSEDSDKPIPYSHENLMMGLGQDIILDLVAAMGVSDKSLKTDSISEETDKVKN